MKSYMLSIVVILLMTFACQGFLAGWMDSLPDDTDIRTMLYPGTHDSGTYNVPESIADKFARCQTMSIREQLDNGIRYLDIRVKDCNDPDNPVKILFGSSRNLQSVSIFDGLGTLCVYHGAFPCNLSFDQVLDQVVGYLKQNPREFILMRLKKQGDGNKGKNPFYLGTLLQDYATRRQETRFWVRQSALQESQTLGSVRGKVLAFIEGASDSFFAYGVPFGSINLGTGDKWEYDNVEQWRDHFVRLLYKASVWQPTSPSSFFLSQSSGISTDLSDEISSIASGAGIGVATGSSWGIFGMAAGAIGGAVISAVSQVKATPDYNPLAFKQSIASEFQRMIQGEEYILNNANAFDETNYLKGIITIDFPDLTEEIMPIVRMNIKTQQFLTNIRKKSLKEIQAAEKRTGNHSIKSFHGTFLSGNDDGTVQLTYNVLGWENWQWQWLGENDFLWKSFHGTYLSANKDGTLQLVKQPKEWEVWTKIQVEGGKSIWKSFHGTYLSGEINMKVTLTKNMDTWEQWQLGDTAEQRNVLASGPAKLKSFHGSFLSGNLQKQVSLKFKVQSEEQWTWLWLGQDKFAWKSFHHTYLSARQDGSVNLQHLLQGWEIWRRIDQNGKHVWKSYHGTYLSANDDLTIDLKKVPLGWEQWTDRNDLTVDPVQPAQPAQANKDEPPGTHLRIINSCPYTIWPGLDGKKNDGSWAFGTKESAKPAGFELKSGESRTISLDTGAIGMRVWARLRCSWQTNNAWPDVKTRFLCEVGECGNPINKWDGTCYSSGGMGGNTLAEFTMNKQGHWYYDISLVDGYTIPVTITPYGKYSKASNVKDSLNCRTASCFPAQDFSQCPPELKSFAAGTNTPISCNSISKAIDDNELKRKFPQLQGYYNDIKTRSHTQCSCLEGSCAGNTADQVARNIRPGTGYCCSPYNPLYLDPRIKDHICYIDQKPKPLNNFGGGKRYDQIFKSICPLAYSWEFDDQKSLFECIGKDVTIEVKFC